jgi:hypothetical protein
MSSDKKKREALTSQRLKIARLQEELAEAQLELEMMVGNACDEASGGSLGGGGVSSFQGFHHLLLLLLLLSLLLFALC